MLWCIKSINKIDNYDFLIIISWNFIDYSKLKKMNRIVIVGNGFDKAHGLPTSYADFTDYLVNSIVKYVPGKYANSKKIEVAGKQCGNKNDLYHRLDQNKEEDPWICARKLKNKFSFELEVNPHSEQRSIYFESLFSDNRKNGYWSDLEAHYFQTIYKFRDTPRSIKIINKEFEHLKKLLREYLKNEVDDKTGDGKMYEINTIHSIYQMLKNGHNDFEFDKNYFINFNYTSKILNQYRFWLNDIIGTENYPVNPIHIHGDLINSQNPIIFGYGDENSSHYNELELLLNNDLLVNFKTFQYLRTGVYKKVLGLLEESENIYIQIIGHSSGLCDKALLRAIFQHKNVKFIESTYYDNESKYFENLYNISRIFDDNTLMRNKIIPLNETFLIK